MIPLTDLTELKVGDIVSFQALFNGKPYHPESIPPAKILGYGELYGTKDNYHYGIWGNLDQEGIGHLRITAPGRWVAQVFVKRPISEICDSEDVSEKALEIAYTATATFFVRQ